MRRTCPYCHQPFTRLDRHLSGRLGCSAEARRHLTAAPTPAREPPPGPPGMPEDLGPEGAKLWSGVLGAYRVEPHLLPVLAAAAREADTAGEAAAEVAKAGPFVRDRFGVQKPHPGIAVARSSRLASARLLRALALPTDEVA
jgi:hypothetical protein